jgi:ABC-type branched-subunit amino acid transport system ATPase component
VRLNGDDVSRMPPQDRVRRGLARTFQQPELFAELTVRQHLILAHRLEANPRRAWTDPLTFAYLREDADEDEAVTSLVELLELEDVADVRIGGLPLGVCRLVEIGRALATEPLVVLLDEPFSGLNAEESKVLSQALTRVVASRGISLLLVEHDIDVVFELCTRVYVLDFGQVIAAGDPTQVRSDQAVRSAYLGEAELAPRQAAAVRTIERSEPQGDKACLQISHLSVRYGNAEALDDVSFSVPEHSVTALLGANGAGKSTLARALSGLIPVASGRVVFDGVDITGAPPERIRRLGLAYLPEGRGVFPALTVDENLRVALQSVRKDQRREAIDRAVHMFPILGDRRTQLAGTLSGGEQQMLSLARVLANPPKLLIADEVSLGLAPLVVDEVFAGLKSAMDLGISVILIEQFVHRALELADHCHFLRRGRHVWGGPTEDARAEVLELYLGHSTAHHGAAGSPTPTRAQGYQPGLESAASAPAGGGLP